MVPTSARPLVVQGSAPAGVRRRTAYISYKRIGLLVGSVECLTILAGCIVGTVGYDWLLGLEDVEWGTALGLGLLSSLLYVLASRSAGLYTLPALVEPARVLSRTLAVCALVFLTLTAMLFLLKISAELSRGSLLGSAAAMLAMCCVVRVGAGSVIESMMRRNAIAGRPAYLVGEASELAALTPGVLLRQFGLRETGRMAMPDSGSKVELASRLDEAMAEARNGQAKEFIVATKWDRTSSLGKIEEALRVSPLPVRLLPNAEVRSIIGRGDAALGGISYAVELQRAPMSAAEELSKRIVDIVLSSAAIVVLMPVFVTAALAVKLDSAGPMIFRQRRNGFDRNQFVIFKFRTMKVIEDGNTIRQARRDDDRITAVGRVLRRTSIDELPQLFNVLRGEMSLVGPRPHALAHDQQYTALIDDYCMRHHVKPGITGWAQIKGCRGETERPEAMKQRVDHDVWYIQNWSLRLDLHILLRTALDVVRHDAY